MMTPDAGTIAIVIAGALAIAAVHTAWLAWRRRSVLAPLERGAGLLGFRARQHEDTLHARGDLAGFHLDFTATASRGDLSLRVRVLHDDLSPRAHWVMHPNGRVLFRLGEHAIDAPSAGIVRVLMPDLYLTSASHPRVALTDLRVSGQSVSTTRRYTEPLAADDVLPELADVLDVLASATWRFSSDADVWRTLALATSLEDEVRAEAAMLALSAPEGAAEEDFLDSLLASELGPRTLAALWIRRPVYAQSMSLEDGLGRVLSSAASLPPTQRDVLFRRVDPSDDLARAIACEDADVGLALLGFDLKSRNLRRAALVLGALREREDAESLSPRIDAVIGPDRELLAGRLTMARHEDERGALSLAQSAGGLTLDGEVA